MNYYELADIIDANFMGRTPDMKEEDIVYEVRKQNLNKMIGDLFYPAYDEYSVSEITGVSVGQIASYMKGKSMPQERTLIKLMAHRNPKSTITTREFVAACQSLCDAYKVIENLHFQEDRRTRYSSRNISKFDAEGRKTSTIYFRHFLAARVAELHAQEVFSKERCPMDLREEDWALEKSGNIDGLVEEVFDSKISNQTQEALDRIAESVASTLIKRWLPVNPKSN